MGTSVIFSSTSNSSEFKHSKETVFLSFPEQYLRFMGVNHVSVDESSLWLEDPESMFFLSDQSKVFITLMNGPYHFFIDSLGPFLHQYEKMPDALFIFDISNLFEFDDKYLNFFTDALRKNGVNFRLIKAEGFKVYAKNCYTGKFIDDSYDAPNRLFKFYKKLVENPDVEPFRKVYVSRSWMPPRPLDNIVQGASFNHDNRIDDEKKLEDFFSSLGFEIIVPEKFESFQDQLNLFYETKTLVSLTSGGMTNVSFMQPGGTVVELINTMVTPMGGSATPTEEGQLFQVEEALHHFYVTLSWRKSHNYVGLDNKRRSADFIIDKIKKSDFLKVIFGI